MDSQIFSTWAPRYREAGYWPRPVTLGTKACHVRDWQKPDDHIASSALSSWLQLNGADGIGLLMGSPFPDGTTLGALDIDHDDYTRIGVALLGNPVCGRVGKKGAVFFVRCRGGIKNFEFRVKGESAARYGKVAECLFTKKLCVIPPTVHPITKAPYQWLGKSLLETSPEELPVVEM